MITMILLLIVALYGALLIWVARKFETWLGRSSVLLLLLSPVIYMVGSYQYIHYRHEQDCAREGGLKLLIQVEKSDHVRLSSDAYSSDRYANGYLSQYFPQLTVVEAWDGEYTGNGRKSGYFSYSPDLTTTALPKKDWKFNKVPLSQPTAGLYEISKSSHIESHLDRTTWNLTRDGRVYATWTMFYHYWSRNGAMNIGWQCFGPSSREWINTEPAETLIALILN